MIMLQALLMIGVRASEIRTYPLDERSVYTVRLSKEEPTTCVFPGPLKAIVGANVSTKIEDNPGILLSHETGTEYFSLRLLKDDANGALNVVFRGKVYALALVTAAEPDRAVAFFDEPLAGGKEHKPATDGLRGLVERAKQLDRADAMFAGMTSTLEQARPGNVTYYRNFTATVESIARFAPEDTLVLRIRLETTQNVPVHYDPQGIAIRLDREIFPTAFTEGTGAIPANGSAVVYLAISGAPGGGRANLSVRQKFSVIVPHP